MEAASPEARAEDAPEVIGRRVAAALVDIALMAVLFVVMALLLGESETTGGNTSIRLEGAEFLLYLGAVYLYYFLAEALTGRTLGKALLGLRVVRREGGRAGTGRIALRTILRLVDSLPALYLLGFVLVLATGQRRQRLGDLAAGTTVARG